MGQVVDLFTREPLLMPPSRDPRRSISNALVDLLERAEAAGDDQAFDAVHEAWVALQHAKLWRAREQASKLNGGNRS